MCVRSKSIGAMLAHQYYHLTSDFCSMIRFRCFYLAKYVCVSLCGFVCATCMRVLCVTVCVCCYCVTTCLRARERVRVVCCVLCVTACVRAWACTSGVLCAVRACVRACACTSGVLCAVRHCVRSCVPCVRARVRVVCCVSLCVVGQTFGVLWVTYFIYMFKQHEDKQSYQRCARVCVCLTVLVQCVRIRSLQPKASFGELITSGLHV